MIEHKIDPKAIAAMTAFLEALGVDLKKLGMEKTPYRVAEAYTAFFSGLQESPDTQWGELIKTSSNGLVAVRNLRFYSICEHHLLPFFGTVQIAYYPHNGQIAGFGHFADVVSVLTRRPQLQERLTSQICDSINAGVHAEGVLVIVQATHLCLTMRNSTALDSDIITAVSSGRLKEGTEQYMEAWKLLTRKDSDE